jgi:hypothetical protein
LAAATGGIAAERCGDADRIAVAKQDGQTCPLSPLPVDVIFLSQIIHTLATFKVEAEINNDGEDFGGGR